MRSIGARRKILGLVAVVVSALACVEPKPVGDPTPAGTDPTSDGTGEVQFELTTVPAGAQCLRVTATPSSGGTVSQNLSLTAGASTTSLSLTGLPQGMLSLSASAYNVACANLGSAVPTWIADPVTAAIRPGVITKVSLTLRANNAVSTSVNFAPNIQSIAAGGNNTFVLTGGAPLQFGYLAYTNVPTPIPSAPTNFTAVAGGALHGCGIRADGTVWCWGWSSDGQCGPNVPLNSISQTPVQVPLTGTFTLIAAGPYHTCALRAQAANAVGDQSVFCWGRNDHGQLGDGTTTSSATPVEVVGIHGIAIRPIRSLSAGDYHNVAVSGDGNMVAWGDNTYGQLGDNSTNAALTARLVYTRTAMAAVGGLGHTCVLQTDSTVQCVGANYSGQLGDGTMVNRMTPVKVSGLPGPVKLLVSGEHNMCALTTAGQVYCWGNNREGELGDFTATDHWTPVQVGFGTETALSIAGGLDHTCALTSGPGLWCWGNNDEGQIGDGTNFYAFGPTKVLLQ
jgi:alpha-tubulin suppressor-like RCC1 family protein